MKSALRKALLPALAATAVMAATPALAQNVGFSISIGSPGYQNGYGYGGYGRGYGYRGNDLQYRAAALSQHVQRLAYSGRLDHFEARNLSHALNQYRQLEWRYARNGLSAREYRDLSYRLDRIEHRLRSDPWSRW
jgi:hypothetical protein